MNKKAFITLMLSLVTLAASAQGQPGTALLGSWTGKLKVLGRSLTLVLHMEQAGDSVRVTLDSPDQGAKGIAGQLNFLSDDSVAVRVPKVNATYRARLRDGQLKGLFTQNGFPLPLMLDKGLEQLNRPQHPAQPYPYRTEEVTFSNAADGATLAGTLTYPEGYETMKKGKVPVVLMVTGSGQENRDEEVFDHRPFLVIADYMARHGIATLRYDDRATGASVGGDVKNATTEDFMRDAAAGLDYLRGLGAFGRVGCLGHSEGGAIAFMLAARKKADFIVTLAAPAVKGDTLLAAQVNRVMQLSGMTANMTTEQYRQQQEVQQVPWLRWFIDYDPSADIRQTRCPVFALNGDRDCQVLSDLNLPAIRQLLPASRKNLVKEYPSLNHLFQHCTTGLPTEYRQIEETISPEVLSDMVSWIHTLTNRR